MFYLQKVLLANGQIKNISDLEIGTKLMPFYSDPRTVQSVTRVEEPCYEIRPLKGEPFILGGSQELELVIDEFDNPDNIDVDLLDYENISVVDYLKKSNQWKSKYKLYRTPINFVFSKNERLPLDSYFLGLLLGSGWLQCEIPLIKTSEFEIVEYIHKKAKQLGAKVITKQAVGTGANSYYFDAINGKNTLISSLKKLCLNKNILLKIYPLYV